MVDPPTIDHSGSIGAGLVEIRHRKKRPILTGQPCGPRSEKSRPRSKSCMADPPIIGHSESIHAGLVEIRHSEKSTVLTASSRKSEVLKQRPRPPCPWTYLRSEGFPVDWCNSQKIEKIKMYGENFGPKRLSRTDHRYGPKTRSWTGVMYGRPPHNRPFWVDRCRSRRNLTPKKTTGFDRSFVRAEVLKKSSKVKVMYGRPPHKGPFRVDPCGSRRNLRCEKIDGFDR